MKKEKIRDDIELLRKELDIIDNFIKNEQSQELRELFGHIEKFEALTKNTLEDIIRFSLKKN